MKTKILVAFFATGLFAAFTMKAQEKETMNMDSVGMDKVTYTCSMHPEVMSDKPGECSKCGMVLTEKTIRPKASLTSKRTKTVKTYVCSMHPDEVSAKSGKCPICGMKLIKAKSSSNKKDAHKVYKTDKSHKHGTNVKM